MNTLVVFLSLALCGLRCILLQKEKCYMFINDSSHKLPQKCTLSIQTNCNIIYLFRPSFGAYNFKASILNICNQTVKRAICGDAYIFDELLIQKIEMFHKQTRSNDRLFATFSATATATSIPRSIK